MEGNTLLTIVGGILILAIIIGVMIIRYKSKPTVYDKDQAEKFLKGLSDAIYVKIVDIINNFDLFKIENIEDFEASILLDIYNTIWDYIEGELKEAAKKDILTAMALKVLNREYVEQFLDILMKENGLVDKMWDKWDKFNENKIDSIEENDRSLQEQFSDPEQYNEDFNPKDLPVAEEQEVNEDEMGDINPPTDEDPEYNDESDSSVESIEDDIFVDSRGRKRSRTTGRFV